MRRKIQDARWIVLEEFLIWKELATLFDYVQTRELDFTTGRMAAACDLEDPDKRRSRVLLDEHPLQREISRRVERYLPWVCRALDHPGFNVSWIGSQIVANNDGDYFRIHEDRTPGSTSSSEFTFVYFFHREPKPFTGGELVLHDTYTAHGKTIPVGVPRAFTPEQNAAVIFSSACLHQIHPVHCLSRRFADRRFTVNGWIHPQ